MQFLVVTERNIDRFTEADFAAVVPDETAVVRGLYADSVLRQIWLRDDVRGAAFILEVDSLDAARATVATLPLAQRSMTTVRIIPLKPYAGFGPA